MDEFAPVFRNNVTNRPSRRQSILLYFDSSILISGGAGWRRVAPGGAGWRRVAPGGAGWRRVVPGGAGWHRAAPRLTDEVVPVGRRAVGRHHAVLRRPARLARVPAGVGGARRVDDERARQRHEDARPVGRHRPLRAAVGRLVQPVRSRLVEQRRARPATGARKADGAALQHEDGCAKKTRRGRLFRFLRRRRETFILAGRSFGFS